jgi:Xaa-Pro aminopeptidase
VKSIPVSEFKDRQRRAQQRVKEAGLDAAIVHSNEADFANVRYLADYWPAFESAGVVLPAEGEPILLIGPESETYARDRSRIGTIRKVLWYRESAEPDYPDIPVSGFTEVLAEACGGRPVRRLGIVGRAIFPMQLADELRKALPGVELVPADAIVGGMRIYKSENELALLREAFRISELALGEVLDQMRPGLTELQVVGIALQAMYREGAEYEAHPQYVMGGPNTNHAISRATHRPLVPGEMIQLNIGARLGGYSPSVGRPCCFGPMPEEMRRLVEVGLEAHRKTMEFMKAGVPAREVVARFEEFVHARGCGGNLLYGPCHGIGLIEVERPWMETTSDYMLEENMTFQVDTFLHTDSYGLRWEDGVRVTAEGVEELSSQHQRVLELPR